MPNKRFDKPALFDHTTELEPDDRHPLANLHHPMGAKLTDPSARKRQEQAWADILELSRHRTELRRRENLRKLFNSKKKKKPK